MLYFYNMSTDDDSDRVFKALASGSRRQMLDSLKAGPQTTGALCDAFPELDRCTVMQHLKVLEDADLVVAQRRAASAGTTSTPCPSATCTTAGSRDTRRTRSICSTG